MSTAAWIAGAEHGHRNNEGLEMAVDLGTLEVRISELQWMGMGGPLTLKEEEELTRLRTAHALYTIYAT